MKNVVIASNNDHKVSEIESALDFEGWTFQTLREAGVDSDPEEDADTFVGNARIKARAAHAITGGAVLADDSGLEVDALDGAPGVLSARYAGGPTKRARPVSCARSSSSTKTGPKRRPAARSKAASDMNRRGRTASATIPSSFPTCSAGR
jgi:inosine/xanthosine triphosphate pyrophosphatase family protein